MTGTNAVQEWYSGSFQTTQWSVVLTAGGTPSPAADEALACLLQTYWFPLYAFVRRRGYSPHDAEDLTQEFFHHVIRRRSLTVADPERGRFRCFLLASLKHFLAHEQEARETVKRGGRVQFVPLSGAELEARFLGGSADALSPERAFDLHWAMGLLEVVLGRLRAEQASSGRTEAFDLLKPFLEGGQLPVRYADVAARLNTSVGAARMMVLRLRRRYRTLISEEIARTLLDPAQADEELQALVAALREAPSA